MVKSPAAKKTIGKIEKLIIKYERQVEKEKLKQLREDYSIKDQKVMKEIMQEQQELAEHLKVLRIELEGSFEKDHKMLKEIKDRAAKIAELQKQLDAVRASLSDIREKLTVKRAQVAAMQTQLAQLLPQVAAAKITLAETVTQISQDSGLSLPDEKMQEFAGCYVNDVEEHLLKGGTVNDFQFDRGAEYKKFEELHLTKVEIDAIRAKKDYLIEKFKELVTDDPSIRILVKEGKVTTEMKKLAREIVDLSQQEEKVQKKEERLEERLGIAPAVQNEREPISLKP